MSETISATTTRKYGCIKSSSTDKYQEKKLCAHATRFSVVESVDLSKILNPIQDQETIGSCVSHSVLAAYASLYKNKSIGSRLYNYYNARRIEGKVDSDNGCQIISGIEALMTKGDVDEALWPYDVKKYTNKPTDDTYEVAIRTKFIAKSVPQALFNIQSTLAEGILIICGILIFKSFESDIVAKTGIVPFPDILQDTILGRHCVIIVGYHNKTKRFKMRNSWGKEFGDNGYFYVDYKYILDYQLASDFYILEISY